MKIKRSQLEQIVKEELAKHISEQLLEAEPKKAAVKDGDEDKKGKEKPAGKGEKSKTEPNKSPDNITPKSKGVPSPDEPSDDAPEQEIPAEPADDELEADVADPEGEEEDPTDAAKSDISDDIMGKTIQSITMEPESKMMPGAQEINITFKEVTDTLKILVGKTGAVKWYWKGLHNEL